MTDTSNFERLADEIDLASEHAQGMLDAQIEKARNAEKPPPSDWDRETCYYCGDELAIERIKARRFLCVPCKTREEKLNKLKGR